MQPSQNGKKGAISVHTAVLVGTVWVTLPVLLIIIGGWLVVFRWVLTAMPDLHYAPPTNLIVGLALVACGIVGPWLAGWIWWSLNIPKWRLWALEKTHDWPALEPYAVAAGLIWKEDNLLGRLCTATEIWSAKDRQRFADLRRGARSG